MYCEFSSNSDIWKGKNVEMEIQGLQHQELEERILSLRGQYLQTVTTLVDIFYTGKLQ